MFCRKCGKKISDESLYCSYCGEATKAQLPIDKLPSTKNSKQEQRKRSYRPNAALWILGGATVVISLFLLGFLGARMLIGGQETAFSVQEAQEVLDTMLEGVFQEADTNNFIAQELRSKVSVRVKSVQRSQDGYSANCIVSSVDLATPILNFLSSQTESSSKKFSDVISDLQNIIADAKEVQETFQIEFTYSNGEYNAILPDKMIIFCSGNLQEILPQLYEILQGGS